MAHAAADAWLRGEARERSEREQEHEQVPRPETGTADRSPSPPLVLTLKELDSSLDIARSTIQIDILAFLHKRPLGAASAEIAKSTGHRRKAITDAARKMKNKGLVEVSEGKRGARYSLTEEGRACAAALTSELAPGGGTGALAPRAPSQRPRPDPLWMLERDPPPAPCPDDAGAKPTTWRTYTS